MHSCCSLICLASLPTHCPHWIMMPCSGYSKAGIIDSLYEHDLNIVPRGSLIQKSCWYRGPPQCVSHLYKRAHISVQPLQAHITPEPASLHVICRYLRKVEVCWFQFPIYAHCISLPTQLVVHPDECDSPATDAQLC